MKPGRALPEMEGVSLGRPPVLPLVWPHNSIFKMWEMNLKKLLIRKKVGSHAKAGGRCVISYPMTALELHERVQLASFS